MNPMTAPLQYSFQRYLEAKKTVDDRALNRHVWRSMADALCAPETPAVLRVLDVGAGIGTMVERVLERKLFPGEVEYLALDSSPENVIEALIRLPRWASYHGFEVSAEGNLLRLNQDEQEMSVQVLHADVFDYASTAPERRVDLLIANAFLDLVDVPTALPKLFRLLKPGGWFYFSVNFDGATLFEPEIDPAFDALLEASYHRTMDERITAGIVSGDSRTGRHLFNHLRAAGTRIIDAGSSDWVVYPGEEGYHADEAYFLHFIVNTIHGALRGHPEIDAERLDGWIAKRHQQIEAQELIYIAHQLDFFGRISR